MADPSSRTAYQRSYGSSRRFPSPSRHRRRPSRRPCRRRSASGWSCSSRRRRQQPPPSRLRARRPKAGEAAPTCGLFSWRLGLSIFFPPPVRPSVRLPVPCRHALQTWRRIACRNGGDFIAAVGGVPRVIQHRAPIAAAVEAPGLFGGRRRNICATPMLLPLLLRIFAGMVETQPRCKQALRHAA